MKGLDRRLPEFVSFLILLELERRGLQQERRRVQQQEQELIGGWI